MDDKTLFLQFWDKEAAATRKVISRIPEGSTYKPDPKSRTAREIAWLIVREEAVLAEGWRKGTLEWQEVAAPATIKEVLGAVRHAACGRDQEAEGALGRPLGAESPVHLPGAGSHERKRIGERVGFLLRHDPPPRSALDVPPPDGLDRSANLRAER